MTCVWDMNPACLDASWEALDADVQERSLMLATSSLQARTNNRGGTCPITIRPMYADCCTCSRGWEPTLHNGQWFNVASVSCGHGHSTSEIDLPGPVGYIDALTIDGVQVDLWNGDWRLDNGHLLVWQGNGPSPIPQTQDLAKPDTEPGTWSVSYSRSYPVGEDAKMAVTYLALEFAKAFAPKARCSLPRGVTSVVRNGVSFSIEAGLFPNGLTGIDIVDQFILKWTPYGSPSRGASVFDPRKAAPRVTNSVPQRSPLGSL